MGVGGQITDRQEKLLRVLGYLMPAGGGLELLLMCLVT
nr:MAG TPA: hypothetical protein [Caudoviricetes sp.]